MRQLARLADGHRMARRYVYMGVWDCSRQRDRARSLRACARHQGGCDGKKLAGVLARVDVRLHREVLHRP